MYPLISIIVPVFKTEKYLENCIKSILNQTYSNLEVLLIDDGSPDNCPEICDNFALTDSRVKVFHKINGGVSSARNIGLENATGEYLCFVDSDDSVFPDYIMSLYNSLVANNCQYAAGKCVDNINDYKSIDKPDVIVDFSEKPSYLLKYISRAGSYSPYAKIFKTSIINDNNIRYDENLKSCEDALFIRQYLKYCSRMVLIPDIIYLYNPDNINSLSKRGYENYYLYYIEKLKALKELVEVLPLSDEQRNNFLSDRAVHGLLISIEHYYLNFSDKNLIKSNIEKSVEVFSKWIYKDSNPTYISNHELNRWIDYKELIFSNKINKIYNRFYFYYLYKKVKIKAKNLMIKFLHK